MRCKKENLSFYQLMKRKEKMQKVNKTKHSKITLKKIKQNSIHRGERYDVRCRQDTLRSLNYIKIKFVLKQSISK